MIWLVVDGWMDSHATMAFNRPMSMDKLHARVSLTSMKLGGVRRRTAESLQ